MIRISKKVLVNIFSILFIFIIVPSASAAVCGDIVGAIDYCPTVSNGTRCANWGGGSPGGSQCGASGDEDAIPAGSYADCNVCQIYTEDVGFGSGSIQSDGNVINATSSIQFIIKNDGKIGIGTTSPSALLTVGDNDQFTVTATGNTNIAGLLTVNDLDSKTATTLLLGESTANRIEIARSTIETEIQGTLNVIEAATLDSTLTVTESTTLNGGLIMDTDRFIVEDGTGNTTIAGDLDIGGGNFTIASTTGSTAIIGNLDIGAGNFTVASTTGDTLIAGITSITDTTESTSSTTGALVVEGGVGIGEDLYIDNDLHVRGDSYLGNIVIESDTINFNNASSTAVNIPMTFSTGGTESMRIDINGNLGVGTTSPVAELAVVGDVYITGQLTAVGGVGLEGDLDMDNNLIINIGNLGTDFTVNALELAGDLIINSDKFVVASTTGNTTIAGNLDIGSGDFTVASTTGNTLIAGITSITNATDSSSTSTGALVVAGGVGVGEDLYVSEDFYVTGNSSITGDLSVDGCFGPVYQATSSSATDGIVGTGGYAGADTVCNSAFNGSHVCRVDEIINSRSCGSSIPASGAYWVNSGSSDVLASDCNGWASSSTDNFGSFWSFDSDGGKSMTTICSNELSIACCK